jgi:hypothetical protein
MWNIMKKYGIPKHMLGNSHMYRNHQLGQQMLSVKSLDWTVAATSTGLFHPIKCGAPYVQLAGQ